MWYVTIEFCHVGVLRIGVHDPGGAKWSCRRFVGPTFERVLTSSISRGHQTLAGAPHGVPFGAGLSLVL